MTTVHLKSRLVTIVLLAMTLFFATNSSAQVPVALQDDLPQQIFSFQQIEVLEDPQAEYTFEQVSSKAFNQKFEASKNSTPQTLNLNTTYWFRINIKHNNQVKKNFLLEFFDQTIDQVTAYIPQNDGAYKERKFGDHYKFNHRELRHKNFELPVDNRNNQVQTYYFKVRSSQISDIIIVLRTVDYFISYALDEYFYFGIFYGMILVFSFYNLIMYISIRQIQYLYYVLYNLSVGFFEMSSDGIAYQYLWPNSPEWNQIAYAFALCATSVFALLFTRSLLFVAAKAPKLNQLILWNHWPQDCFFLLLPAFRPKLVQL